VLPILTQVEELSRDFLSFDMAFVKRSANLGAHLLTKHAWFENFCYHAFSMTVLMSIN
jgi:hypothetical protein